MFAGESAVSIPFFFGIFCIYVLVSYLLPSVSKLPHSTSRQILYLLENLLFLPGIFAINPMITVSWSLSYEFFFYLSMPLVVKFTGMRKWHRLRRILFFACLFLIHCIGYRAGLIPHIRLSMFIAGILLFEVVDGGWMDAKLRTAGELLVLGFYGATLGALSLFEFSNTRIVFNPHFPNLSSVYWTALLSLALFGLALYCFSYDGIVKSVFSWRPIRWLGNMSYTFFLCHGLVLYGIARVVNRLLPAASRSAALFLALLVLNLLVSLIASLILFLLIEKPFSLTVKHSVPIANDLQAARRPQP